MTTGSREDFGHMAHALRLARQGLFTTRSNPRVGCVLVRDGRVVGQGFHRRPGGAHAEVFALEDAGGNARGATAYITLEPCCHFGRTPPCTETLIASGIERAVIAARDPDSRVSGQGMDRLRKAGIPVTEGVLEGDARALNPGFFSRMERQRPWVRVKSAMSLDGRTALADGASAWISGEASRRDVQFLRARSSAILTGVGTVSADDPGLNLRLSPADLRIEAHAEVAQPLRVVLDTRMRVSPAARMFSLPGPCLVIAGSPDVSRQAALEDSGVEVAVAGTDREGRVDLRSVLRLLAEREINEVQVEAGSTLVGSLLRDGLVDELVVYMATLLLGSDARSLAELPPVRSMAERMTLRLHDLRRVGNDLRLDLRPVYASAS